LAGLLQQVWWAGAGDGGQPCQPSTCPPAAARGRQPGVPEPQHLPPAGWARPGQQEPPPSTGTGQPQHARACRDEGQPAGFSWPAASPHRCQNIFNPAGFPRPASSSTLESGSTLHLLPTCLPNPPVQPAALAPGLHPRVQPSGSKPPLSGRTSGQSPGLSQARN